MRKIAINDATATLSELCESVERTGEPVQITRQGKPVAMIAQWNHAGIWAAREEFERQHGPLSDDFEIPTRSIDDRSFKNPLE